MTGSSSQKAPGQGPQALSGSEKNHAEGGAVKAIRRAVKDSGRCQGLWSPGQRVMVACSGGPDSLCLLHALREVAPEEELTIIVGHVDHQLRPSSEEDARFVACMAQRWGLDYKVAQVTVRGTGEAGAREARYEALMALAEGLDAQVVATAHTADDQAETLIMRLIRGTGLRGLQGIPARRGKVVRPLLGVSRNLVEVYLDEVGLQGRRDPTNEDLQPFRNRVRRRILPALKEENPALVEALGRLANNAHVEAAALQYLALNGVSRIIPGPRGAVAVRLEMGDLPSETAPRIGVFSYRLRWAHERVRRALIVGQRPRMEGRGPSGHQLGRAHILAVEKVFSTAKGRELRRVSLPGKVVALVAETWVGVVQESWMKTPRHLEWEVFPGEALAPGGFVFRGWADETSGAGRGRAGHPRKLKARTRLPGDRIRRPAGRRKVQDHFVDCGVPTPLRQWIPLTPLGCVAEGDPVSVVALPVRRKDGAFEISTSIGIAVLDLRPDSLEAALADIFGTFGL